jgi:nudix-type nucleoside diphosphatase (YffH/AdpP family)
MARLDFYESAFGYRRSDVLLEGGQKATAYFPPEGQRAGAAPWALSEWERDWAELSVLAAREVMTYSGEKPPQEVGVLFPMIRARAWSRINAAKSRHGALTMAGSVDVNEYRRPYSRYFALEEYELRHARFDGTMTPRLLRAVFRAPDAAMVLPYDPYRDRVLLVEQMRMGPLARGDRAVWQLEPVAGRLDPGETPQDAARREAREETGLDLDVLEQVAETYCSPGNSSEFYYIYVGLADLPDTVTGIGGLEDEAEDIRSHVLGFDKLMDLCDSFQIGNAPLVMAAYWLARHRGRLRERAGVR